VVNEGFHRFVTHLLGYSAAMLMHGSSLLLEAMTRSSGIETTHRAAYTQPIQTSER
jgi:hypothetical protein